MIAAALVAVLAAAPSEAPRFTPLVDHQYRYVTEDVREVGGRPRRFVAERRLVFRTTDGGLVAEVTLDRLFTDVPGEIGRRFLVGSAGLKGRTIRFRLAPDGDILGVEDEQAVWAAMLAGPTRLATPRNDRVARSPVSRRPAAAMESLPPEARRKVIASIIAGLFVDPAAMPPPGGRPVTLTSRPLPGISVLLTGQETALSDPDGRLRLVTRAADDRVTVTRTRVVDAATGLLARDEELTEWHGDGHVHFSRSVRTIDTPVS